MQLHHGDCLDVMRAMPSNSVDSIVTDPPYGLSFMGKRWDYDVPSVEIWSECLRVLKPGGHLLAFAGTRTQHRMAVRIEDAGFEIRDMIAWVYGSGFPKSLDVSKALDKHGPSGQVPFAEFAAHYEERRKACGLTHAQVCAAGGWHGAINHGGTSANWANGHGMPTVEQWEILQPLLGLGYEWAVRVEREQYEREVIGKRAVNRGVAFTSEGPDEILVTAPGSDAARQWQGWGTALKPALEPITVARKPLVGTVAGNVLEYGTGALNIDGCRVGIDPVADASQLRTMTRNARVGDDGWGMSTLGGDTPQVVRAEGRWPANLIHDGSDEVLAGFPEVKPHGKPAFTSTMGGAFGNGKAAGSLNQFSDTGSAARFFYCAKASKKDRGEGNAHPTVKPTDLMAYLCRLVTPPGGVVLDPFMGSGSTGKAAVREGFHFVGIEREAEYLRIAQARISAQIAATREQQTPPPQNDLFSEILQA